jgi:hypothetical protein
VLPRETFERLDLAIDGTDQVAVAPTGWLVRGGGGAHTREKLAAAAERSAVITSSDKLLATSGVTQTLPGNKLGNKRSPTAPTKPLYLDVRPDGDAQIPTNRHHPDT